MEHLYIDLDFNMSVYKNAITSITGCGKTIGLTPCHGYGLYHSDKLGDKFGHWLKQKLSDCTTRDSFVAKCRVLAGRYTSDLPSSLFEGLYDRTHLDGKLRDDVEEHILDWMVEAHYLCHRGFEPWHGSLFLAFPEDDPMATLGGDGYIQAFYARCSAQCTLDGKRERACISERISAGWLRSRDTVLQEVTNLDLIYAVEKVFHVTPWATVLVLAWSFEPWQDEFLDHGALARGWRFGSYEEETTDTESCEDERIVYKYKSSDVRDPDGIVFLRKEV